MEHDIKALHYEHS